MYFTCRRASNGKGEETLRDGHCCAAGRRPRHLLPDFADLLCPDLSLVHAPIIPGLLANSHVSLQLGKETQSIKHTHNFNFSGGLTTSQFPVFTLYLQVNCQQNQMKNISKTKNLETLPSAAPWSPVLPACVDL